MESKTKDNDLKREVLVGVIQAGATLVTESPA